jgi:hypothetical protein
MMMRRWPREDYWMVNNIDMKKIGLATLLLLSGKLMMGQSAFTCDQFVVQQVQADSVNGNWEVTISFEADANAFINYPYVALMITSSGDTVAQGGLEYFGQMGQTDNIYHPNGILWSNSFVGDIYFVYDSDTCIFNFDGIQEVSDLADNHSLISYPNPAKELVRWNIQEQYVDELIVFDGLGSAVFRGSHTAEWKPNENLSGVFTYQLKSGNRSYSGRLLLIP